MKHILNKYVIITISIYAFWILAIPFIFSQITPRVCENISLNSNYIVEINKPQLFLSPLPVAKIKAKSVKIKLKSGEESTNIDNFETSLRLLPLFSGRIHINEIKANEVIINSVLKKEFELDKDFFSNIRKTKITCDEIKIQKFSVNIIEPNVLFLRFRQMTFISKKMSEH